MVGDHFHRLSVRSVPQCRSVTRSAHTHILPQAFFVFWKEIGKRMNLKDIPETLHDLIEFNAVSEDSSARKSQLHLFVGLYERAYDSGYYEP